LFVARIDSGTKDPHAVIINPLIAQIFITREGREAGNEPLSLAQLTRYVVRNTAYVANEGANFRLNGVLGYCITGPAESGIITVEEGAVRDAGHSRMPQAQPLMGAVPLANVPLQGAPAPSVHIGNEGYRRVVGGMFAPILEDYASGAEEVSEQLAGVRFRVTSPNPSRYARQTMSGLALEHVGSGFEGDAADVYAAIGGLGLEAVWPKTPVPEDGAGATQPQPPQV
jgi:hypothetical protein